MSDVSSLALAVNAKKFNVYVGSTSNELNHLQSARMGIVHSEDPEDTTSGGVVYFSGNDRFYLEGTSLYSEGMYDESPLSVGTLLTRTNGEVAQGTWIVKLTAKNGTTDTYTLVARLEQFIPEMSVPGGTKVFIRLVIESIAVT